MLPFNFHIQAFLVLTNDNVSSGFSSFKFVILRQILGEERNQTIFKIIALQRMVLFHQVQKL
ncbi:unnamed protein product, partial [Vitis vinifera]|uniref:Uncharacterized protein n=1 Tax=Vitis vinifera TaxID=29760 RepID=D7SZZ2_VITVI